MMRPRTIRRITWVLVLIVGLTFVAGWEIVAGHQVWADWIDYGFRDIF